MADDPTIDRFDRVAARVRARLEASHREALLRAEWIWGDSDNGEDDWETPYFITIFLNPDADESAYAMCDLDFGDEDMQIDYLIEQLLEGLPVAS